MQSMKNDKHIQFASELIQIEFQEQIYYEEKNLLLFDPQYFYGCSKSRSMIVKKQMVENIDYMQGVYDKQTKKWRNSTVAYKRSKLLINAKWAASNIPRLQQTIKTPNITTNIENMNYSNNTDADDTVIIPKQPPLLHLDECEKFRDNKQNIIDIEVRGLRQYKHCYFKVSDIRTGFNMPHLHSTLSNKQGYIRGVHYECFRRETYVNADTNTKTNIDPTFKVNQIMFLTYKGMLKVLFNSRSGNAEAFQDWATEKLFTVQLGIQETKEQLASDLVKTDVDCIKHIYRCNAEIKTPCIYLFAIGKASVILPKTVKYSTNAKSTDEYWVYKYGFTDNFTRRAHEHECEFKKEFGITSIELSCFAIIDPKYLSKAEVAAKHYFSRDHIEYLSRKGNISKELIVLPKSSINKCKEQFGLIQNSYNVGNTTDLVGKIEQMQRKYADLEHLYKCEIMEKNYCILQRDKTIETNALLYKHALLEKDMTILQQKNTFETQQLNTKNEFLEMKMKYMTLRSSTNIISKY